jgi:hypothetical protein
MKQYEFHPLADIYPMMDAEKFAELCEDIRTNGFNPKQPIWLYENKVIDGRNRYKACKEVNAEGVFARMPKNIDPEDFMREQNTTRRHQSNAELERIERGRAERIKKRLAQGQSTRTVAQAEGCSQTTVQRVKNKSANVDEKKTTEKSKNTEKSGVSGEPSGSPEKDASSSVDASSNGHSANGKVQGRDGKAYPGRKKKGDSEEEKPKHKEREPGSDDDDSELVEIKDKNGVVVPAQAYEAFSEAAELNKLLHDLDEIARRVKEFGAKKSSTFMSIQHSEEEIRGVRRTLHANRPSYVCPYCKAKKKDCRVCKGGGWITVDMYNRTPSELQGAKK